MRATVSTADLLGAVTFLSRVVERRGYIPALQCIRITASGGALHLAATNSDIWAEARVTAEVADHPGALIDAALLRQFLASAPKGSETAIEVGESAKLAAGRSTLEIATLPLEDAPEAPQRTVTLGEVDDTFAPALLAANAAAGTEQTRFYLCGVYLDGGHAVATDGNALACIDHPAALGGAIIPREAVPVIAELLKDGGRFGASETGWRAEAGDRTLSGKVIDASFPDWRRVTVASAPTILVDRDALLTALGGAMLGDTRIVTLTAAADKGLALAPDSGQDHRIRSGRVEIDAEVKADALIGASGKLLKAMLEVMPDAELAITPGNGITPIRIEPANGSAFMGRFTIVMPYRIGSARSEAA